MVPRSAPGLRLPSGPPGRDHEGDPARLGAHLPRGELSADVEGLTIGQTRREAGFDGSQLPGLPDRPESPVPYPGSGAEPCKERNKPMIWLLVVLVLAAIFLAIWWRLTRRPLARTQGLRGIRGQRLTMGMNDEGHSVWSYEEGQWRLVEDQSAPGFVPGPAPAEPGLYEG